MSSTKTVFAILYDHDPYTSLYLYLDKDIEKRAGSRSGYR